MSIYRADATQPLPFQEKEFDYIFQAGLLEHFNRDERNDLLSNWKRYGKRMVSMIPNAHSIAYRYGKLKQEKEGTWQWGLEMPQSSLREEFEQAGITNITEYSIGAEHAFSFLPKGHYLRVALERAFQEAEDIDDWGQGYLLVTTGDCINES